MQEKLEKAYVCKDILVKWNKQKDFAFWFFWQNYESLSFKITCNII